MVEVREQKDGTRKYGREIMGTQGERVRGSRGRDTGKQEKKGGKEGDERD